MSCLSFLGAIWREKPHSDSLDPKAGYSRVIRGSLNKSMNLGATSALNARVQVYCRTNLFLIYGCSCDFPFA